MNDWDDYVDCCVLVGAEPSRLDFCLSHPIEAARMATAATRDRISDRLWAWADDLCWWLVAVTTRRRYPNRGVIRLETWR